MPATRNVSVTLPSDLADAMDREVRSGSFGSVSELVGESVRSFIEPDPELEQWLLTEVLASCRETALDPERGIPLEDVARDLTRRAALRAE